MSALMMWLSEASSCSSNPLRFMVEPLLLYSSTHSPAGSVTLAGVAMNSLITKSPASGRTVVESMAGALTSARSSATTEHSQVSPSSVSTLEIVHRPSYAGAAVPSIVQVTR